MELNRTRTFAIIVALWGLVALAFACQPSYHRGAAGLQRAPDRGVYKAPDPQHGPDRGESGAPGPTKSPASDEAKAPRPMASPPRTHATPTPRETGVDDPPSVRRTWERGRGEADAGVDDESEE
jgi:hypothetical protein